MVEYCSFCGKEIDTNIVWMTECFTCGQFLPTCRSEQCMDTFDCQDCLNQPDR